MARYGNVVYKGAYYGEVPRTPFSVEPFTATAIDYDKVFLSWNTPVGDLNGIRLVRNQEGFSECPEDGVVLLEVNSTTGEFGATAFTDGVDNFLDSNPRNDISLVSGRWVYYRMWVRRNDNLWVAANDVYIVLPKEHGTVLPDGTKLQTTHSAFMDLLPRVYSSAEQSPLGTVDSDSTLFNFLQAMSFTLDELLTLADLLVPDYSNRNSGPGLLQLKQADYGLQQEEPDAIVRQKRLVREAIYMYSRKGTLTALGTMIESLTGYAPAITPTKNLMLTIEDSTFYKGIGAWRAVKAEAELNTITRPPEVAGSLDPYHSLYVSVANDGGRIENGTYRPTTRGIPLPEIDDYVFSYYAQLAYAGTVDPIAATIVWYNQHGVELSRSVASSTDITNTWARHFVTGRSPGFTGEVVSYSVENDVVTLTFSEDHTLEEGQQLSVRGIGDGFDSTFTISLVTNNTASFTFETDDVEETEVDAVAFVERAVYAGLVLTFPASSVIIDLVHFARGTTPPAYDEPRGVNIFLESTKANYLNNPSFVPDGTAWSISGSTWEYVTSTLPFIYAGDTMLEIESAAAGDVVLSTTVEPQNLPVDKSYVFSTYLRTPGSGEEVTLTITATDGDNTATRTSSTFTVTSAWSRPYVELYISDEFDSSTLEFEVEITVTSNNNGNIQVESAQLEVGYFPTDYFDGSYPPEYGVTWAGDENESASHCYKIKQLKIIRLIQELESYLPSHTPYVVSSYAGTEVTGITL